MSQTKAQLLDGKASSIEFNTGSASSPTISFTGDTNTGIYSSGTDQVSIATGGTERLRVDANGQIEAVSLGSASAPTYSWTGDPNTGIYSPGADQVAISTNGTGRLFVDASGNVGVGTSTAPGSNGKGIALYDASFPRLSFRNSTTGDANTDGTQMLMNGSNFIIANTENGYTSFETNGSERMRLDSSGRLGLGTTSVAALLHLNGGSAALPVTSGTTQSAGNRLRLSTATGSGILDVGCAGGSGMWLQSTDSTDLSIEYPLLLNPNGGSVGIGTTSPEYTLDSRGSINVSGSIFRRSADNATLSITNRAAQPLTFGTDDTERARIDSSGRLLVGTSTSRSGWFNNSPWGNPTLQVEGTSVFNSGISVTNNSNDDNGSQIILGKSRATSVGGVTVVSSGDSVGRISFQGADGTELVAAATIEAAVDGTPGNNDMPGRLVFSVTRDGSASPTEALRIDNTGAVLIGTTDDFPTGNNVTGTVLNAGGSGFSIGRFSSTSAEALDVNRRSTDGTLVKFRQDGTEEGSISVSGTTVSYNGAHLSRWSQLPGGAEREEILRGTVLSNIDEMCAWGEEDNEQLNRMQVSEVEGDPNVAGVFQDWDDDDDTYTDDFYCAMTGDFIIRIAEGVTVQRGQLLMSAGDGTAKPQGDGFVQDKTIAKVTSTHVTCTYDDGSYCVPCVLMAC
jgi:hypothetical protein